MCEAPTLYLFESDTGEFLRSKPARRSPLEPGVFLYPKNSTETEPPEPQEGQAICWRDGAWTYVEDNRGKMAFGPKGQHATVAFLGPLPEGWSYDAPEEPEPTEWRIRTYVIISRLQAIDARDETSLFLACYGKLKSNPDLDSRWNSVDAMGGVPHDDSRMIGALQELGATDDQITEILAPEGQSPREGE